MTPNEDKQFPYKAFHHNPTRPNLTPTPTYSNKFHTMLMYITFDLTWLKNLERKVWGVGSCQDWTLDILVSLSPAAVLDASPLLGSGPSLVTGPFLGAGPPLSELGPSPKTRVNVMLVSVYIKAFNMMRDRTLRRVRGRGSS